MWRMTVLDAGDYLLPSNDRQTLWRIRSYWENGSATYVDARGKEREIRGTFWSTWKYLGGTHDDFLASVERMVDFEEFRESLRDERLWREWSSGFKTRRDAIEDALR
jgi:hypothetical protein